MKTKSRQNEKSIHQTSTTTLNSTGQVLSFAEEDSFYTSLFEELTSTNRRESDFNTCEHFKYLQEVESEMRVGCWYAPTNHTDHVDYVHFAEIDGPTGMRARVKTHAGMSMTQWGQFAQRAIEAMTPTLESGFSLGNFAWELREIKQLVRWWNDRSGIINNISNAVLNYSFGVVPFTMDLHRLANSLIWLQDKLSEMKKGAGKLQVRHYTEEVAYGEESIDSWMATPTHEIRGTLYYPSTKYTATMTYTYQMPEIDSDKLALYALMDAIGIQLNPKILWDGIPYTFVADWLFNIGDFLNQLRQKWVPVTITIKDFGVSAKIPFRGYTENRGVGVVNSPWVSRTAFYGKYYHRFPLKLEDRCFSVSQIGDLTSRKFVLGSLLLQQRVLGALVRQIH